MEIIECRSSCRQDAYLKIQKPLNPKYPIHKITGTGAEENNRNRYILKIIILYCKINAREHDEKQAERKRILMH